MEDKRIIALFWERSADAVAEMARKYGGYCYRIAYNILHCREDAEECVNDTYLRAWNAIPPSRPARLQAYLGKITRNLSLNRYEKQNAGKRGGGQVPALLDELQECIPDGSGASVVDDIVLKDLLDRFLGSLPAKARDAFVLRYWHAYSAEEIGRMLGISKENVGVTLFRTREKLKKQLLEEGVTL